MYGHFFERGDTKNAKNGIKRGRFMVLALKSRVYRQWH